MKRAIAIVLAGIVLVSMVALIAGCRGPEGNIENITMDTSESGVVTIKNYKVHLKSDVDWAALNESQREDIARSGFNKAQEQIQAGKVFNYNITGYTADGALAFMYDRENKEMLVTVGGQLVTTFALEPPAS